MACLHCITIFWMMVAAPILAKNYTVKFEVWYFKQFFLNHIIMIKNMLHIFFCIHSHDLHLLYVNYNSMDYKTPKAKPKKEYLHSNTKSNVNMSCFVKKNDKQTVGKT